MRASNFWEPQLKGDPHIPGFYLQEPLQVFTAKEPLVAVAGEGEE